MRIPREAYRSRMYLSFKEIDSKEYQTIVRFFEQYADDIRQLTFDEYFEMLLTYMDALFEVGAYSNYIDSCDYAIESVIYFNVDYYNGENIYRKLLFRKAASLYHLMEYEQCKHILYELISMDPYDTISIQFLKKCKRAQPPRIVRKGRSVSVLLFILSALIIGVELLVIKTWFPQFGHATEYTRNVSFGLGWSALIGSAVFLRYEANRQVNQRVQMIKQQKQAKKEIT